MLAHGFARLACAGCRAEVLVPFSCKSRGVCPSCNARRAQDTAIHADTWLHENDVTGLERLCNDGARGPLSLERLSALPDGRLAYRMKRPSPSGQTHLVLSPLTFLRRLAALVPPPRANLVRYFGVFAPNARVRPRVVPAPPAPALPEAAPCPAAPEPVPKRSPRRLVAEEGQNVGVDLR